MKRQVFLQSFFRVLGAQKVIWGDIKENSISGTIVYDLSDPEETQDFIWHETEGGTPAEGLVEVMNYLFENELIRGDKISIPISNLKIPGISIQLQEKLFAELFEVSVCMVDDGEETDFFFIHT